MATYEDRIVDGVVLHNLIDGTLFNEPGYGIIARCICGWTSGYYHTSLSASAEFAEHRKSPAAYEATWYRPSRAP